MELMGAALVIAGLAASTVGACGARSELPIPRPPVDPATCDENFSATAEPVTLVVFMVFDTSGSMAGETAAGNTKWEAVTEAMTAFLLDPEAAAIRVALSFFPKHDLMVPAYCQGGWGCEPTSACVPIGYCVPLGGGLCTQSSQCPDQGDQCELMGYCSGTGDPCDPTEVDCEDGDGACTSVGYCSNHTLCDAKDYLIPALGTLPDDAPWALTAITTANIDGFTPTLPAFAGAVSSATAWRENHDKDEVVVVLATDGVPTLCDPALQSDGLPAAIDNLDAVATDGLDAGVRSFVIGVFAPPEEAAATVYLDQIADAGGTSSAFIVSTEQDVAARLLEAFNAVRDVAICEYQIPPEGMDFDLTRFRVTITTIGGTAIELERHGSAAECDPVTGGFYYDHDPSGPTPATRIILCPASCALEPMALQVACIP
ncbi:MAG: hypothetical protein DRI90_05005 [Deltaproteobacteria bacterium]|nr:MAG: hypothetical protein DRI90_05005 [Deltaproteobacteria bacterium]